MNTWRVTTLALILVIGGMAAPRLRDLAGMTPPVGAPGGRLAQVEDAAKAVTTRQRMKCIKGALKLWSAQHGVPDEGYIGSIVGQNTCKDGWGRPIRLILPTEDTPGCLRSLGPDGVRSADDISVSVIWNDIHRKQIAPGWE